MSAEPGVSTAEMSPPTEALSTIDAPGDGPGTDLVPAPPLDGEPQWEDAKRAKEPKPPRAKRPKSPGRTTRVVLRRLDPWAVLKLSVVFYLALFVVVLVAGVVLWAGASAAGVVENIENFMIDIGFEDFRFIPSKLLGGVALGGLVLVVAGTFANVLMTALFNLMGDVVGGLRITLQEDVARPPKAKRAKGGDGQATV